MSHSDTISSLNTANTLPAIITVDRPQRSEDSTLSDSLLNSVTISLVEAPWWIAMLALVFTGSLAPYLDQAAMFLMAGGLISMTIISSMSSWKGSIWIPQDVPTALLVVSTTEITRRIAATVSSETLFATVVVTIGLASVSMGLVFYVLGSFKLGDLVKRLPYPVLAGFLGATGCLLVMGGINNSLIDPTSSNLMEPETVARWLPAVALALLTYTLGRHIKHALLIPALMLMATIVFFAVTSVLGLSVDSLNNEGWLFAALPSADQATGISFAQFSKIEWGVIWSQSGSLLLLATVSAIAMLLNNSGFEMSVKGKFDQNKDLRTTGIANILAGFVGGWPGYMSPAWSSINARQGKQLPLTGFIAAILTAVLLWYATQLIELLPRFVISSAIAYVGITFLFDWVITPAKHLSAINYLAVLFAMVIFVILGSML